jgi:hypothetical protein
MHIDLLPATSRGHFDFGWLNTKHSFSFGEYQNPQRVNFGPLRVVNDDLIKPHGKFNLHPHRDMEIITIVLKGVIEHRDSLGNITQIKAGQIQVMTAGSGIQHSEANPLPDQDLELFQIWIHPRAKNLVPAYAERDFSQLLATSNCWHNLVAPFAQHDELVINQDAYLALTKLTANMLLNYVPHKLTNGVFFMLIDGDATIAKQNLSKRDALMITDSEGEIPILASTDCQVLAIEVPLSFG